MALREWPKLSNVEIARICAVDDHTVKTSRVELEAGSEIPRLKTRIGSDGKEYRLPKAKVKAAPEEAEPPHIRSADEVMAQQEAEREWTGRRSVLGTPPSGLPFNPTPRTA